MPEIEPKANIFFTIIVGMELNDYPKILVDNFLEKANFSKEALDLFFAVVHRKEIPKNKYITRIGERPASMVLIEKGCLMTFVEDESGMKHAIQFGTTRWWTGDLEAFTKNLPSNHGVKSITDAVVYVLYIDDFNMICEKFPAFEKYFRQLFQNALINHQKRIIRNISFTAEARYKSFTQYYPKIETIVPQKYIASYLGITPEFLSKMRKRLLHE